MANKEPNVSNKKECNMANDNTAGKISFTLEFDENLSPDDIVRELQKMIDGGFEMPWQDSNGRSVRPY